MIQSTKRSVHTYLSAVLLVSVFLIMGCEEFTGKAAGSLAGVEGLMAAASTTCTTASCSQAATAACTNLARYTNLVSVYPESVKSACATRGFAQFTASPVLSLTTLQPQLATMSTSQLQEQQASAGTELSELNMLSNTLDTLLPATTSKQVSAQTKLSSLKGESATLAETMKTLDNVIAGKKLEGITLKIKDRLNVNNQLKTLNTQRKNAETQLNKKMSEIAVKTAEIQKISLELQLATELQTRIRTRQLELEQINTEVRKQLEQKREGELNPGDTDVRDVREKSVNTKPPTGGPYCSCEAGVYGKKTTYRLLNADYVETLRKRYPDKYDPGTKLPKRETREKLEPDTPQIAVNKKTADREMKPDRVWEEENQYYYTEDFNYHPAAKGYPQLVEITVENRKDIYEFKTIEPPTPCTSHKQCQDDCIARLNIPLSSLSTVLFYKASDDVKELVAALTGERIAREKTGSSGVTVIKNWPDKDKQFVGIAGVCLDPGTGTPIG
ncbi:hypothetical protein J4207_03155 [Candidatus Woesearchaeota archaeon]|nr:hypothetical protein [Candidatus Woesearchaeota archaeon]